MAKQHSKYAACLATWWTRQEPGFSLHPDFPHRVIVTDECGDPVTLDFTPFELIPQPATAGVYFADVTTTMDLLAAYHAASHSVTLESDLPTLSDGLHPYANEFLHTLIARASTTIDDDTAKRIANWVKNFDVYVAVKVVESLFNSHADRVLLEVAEEQDWTVLFDHLAIRCGAAKNQGGKQVASLLCEQHGYTPASVQGEQMYRFTDGWNAYPLYKILDNGQVLRLFLDESDGTNPTQIIQHWNWVYGYTAHHLALRVTERINGQRQAVALNVLADTLSAKGIGIMAPTGSYTHGLLVQVFTRPEWNPDIPADIKSSLSVVSPNLESVIRNGKLLELLSRAEAPLELAHVFFALYDLNYDAGNPLHSVPVYQYFLLGQAAHVIRTSIDTQYKETAGTGLD